MTFLCLLGADTGARGSTRSVSSPTAAPGPGCLLRHSHGPFEGPGFNPGVLAARVSLEPAQPGHNPGVTGWAGRLLCPPQPEHSTASPCQNSPGSSVGGGSRGPKGRRGTVTNEDGTGGISLSRLAPVKAMAGRSAEEAGNREQGTDPERRHHQGPDQSRGVAGDRTAKLHTSSASPAPGIARHCPQGIPRLLSRSAAIPPPRPGGWAGTSPLGPSRRHPTAPRKHPGAPTEPRTPSVAPLCCYKIHQVHFLWQRLPGAEPSAQHGQGQLWLQGHRDCESPL